VTRFRLIAAVQVQPARKASQGHLRQRYDNYGVYHLMEFVLTPPACLVRVSDIVCMLSDECALSYVLWRQRTVMCYGGRGVRTPFK
jgi:hypothetical protein